MNDRPLLVISTRLPPQVCGIGTYSWFLHQHWPKNTHAQQFIVIEGAAQSTAGVPARITEFGGKAAALRGILDRAEGADVLLHYAGRAYHPYGCPTWLPKVLAHWKANSRGGRLAIIFHEVPGQLPITSRHYWLNLCNERVIRNLARTADLLITNTAEHAAKIEALSGRSDVHNVVVGSNIESAASPAEKTKRSFVVFGLPFGRWETLKMFDQEIRRWRADGLIDELHLIGPRDAKFSRRIETLILKYPDPAFVVCHGELPNAEVSNALARMQFALTNVSPENWSKSTAFMAYAAHKCAIVTKAKAEMEPLSFTLSSVEVATLPKEELKRRTEALHDWYVKNASWDLIARRIHNLVAAPKSLA